MEGIVDTNPVPAVEEPEFTSDATIAPGSGEPTASDSSGGGDGSAISCPWSLTHEQQVHNLKENWKEAFYWNVPRHTSVDSTTPWLERVMTKLRDDPCLKSVETDELSIGPGVTSRVRMTSLDLAILMGDLKMVQKIFEEGDVPDTLLWLMATPMGLEESLSAISPKKSRLLCTPLHLAVVGGDSHIVDVLLEKGADVNASNWRTETPLHVACKMGSVDMLLKLLEKDKEKKDPLHVAVQHGDIEFMKKLPFKNVNALAPRGRTLLHYLATKKHFHSSHVIKVIEFLHQDYTLDMNALDSDNLSAFYVAVLYRNIQFVIALSEAFQNQIAINEACDEDLGPPIQIAFEGGNDYKDIQSALMECESVKGYMERLYRDRQVYVDAANAILVGVTLIASVTFASWLQPPLNYTSYFGEGYASSVPTPSISDRSYVDVEHNIALRAFWVFNALSFYFATGTVVCGAQSVLPRSHLFIKKNVDKLRTNLLVTSILLAFSMLFVIIAFAIAGTIVLTPLLKYQWCMIIPTLVGGMVCIISLGCLVKSIMEIYSNTRENDNLFTKKGYDYLEERGYKVSYTF